MTYKPNIIVFFVAYILMNIFNVSAIDFKANTQQNSESNSIVKKIKIDLTTLKIKGEIDSRYQSVNIEMCEVVGGKFWIPYDLIDSANIKKDGFKALKRQIPAINLYDNKLRYLTSSLGPMYIRVSGTWANTIFFQNDDNSKLSEIPKGYENILTRKDWKGVVEFCKAINGNLTTSFAVCNGIRDKEGNWTPIQAESLINYTKSIGGKIYAAEMFNEPSHASYGGAPQNYNATMFAKDFLAFKAFVRSSYPDMRILGPGSTGEGGIIPVGKAMSTDSIFGANPKPEFDIFSYHFYGGVSKRCMGNLTPENALSNDWLSKTELGLKFYENARDKYQPGKPIWLTETAEAACGGNPWAATYIDCFRYLEQLGRLAKRGVKVVMHNTLSASEYGLLDQTTLDPRPNYWAALLWSKFMGTTVFEMDCSNNQGCPDIFIHSLKGNSKGKTVLIINPKNDEFYIEVPNRATKYIITADKLLSKTICLNGKELTLNSKGVLPTIKGLKTNSGKLLIPAYSIIFLTTEK